MNSTHRRRLNGVVSAVTTALSVGTALCLGVVLSLGLVLAAAPSAHGQVAPAGNEHPQTRMLREGNIVNPFGEPSREVIDPLEKLAFQRKLDLNPLRELGLYHEGRVKILDTIARDVVLEIHGRSRMQIAATPPGGAPGEMVQVRYDALFTFLDMIIDPSFYQDRPIIHVNYLPLRERLLEEIYSDPKQRERMKLVGRLSPVNVSMHLKTAGTRDMSDAYQSAAGKVHEALMEFVMASKLLMMVPGESASSPWLHLSTMGSETPVGKATRELGAAWRARDADRVNSAVRMLAEELPKVNKAVYPAESRRDLEVFYNRANAFEWGAWLYALALVGMLLALGTGRRWLLWTGGAFLAGAVLLHAGGFAARCLIADRFAIQNQFESMTGVSLFAAIVGLGLALVKRQAIYGVAVAAAGFMILIVATQMGIPGVNIGREAAILNTSVLLKYHVTTVLFSYGLITLGLIVSSFYLLTHYAAAWRARQAAGGLAAGVAGVGGGVGVGANQSTPAALSAAALGIGGVDKPTGTARVLSDLDAAQMTVLQLAFWTLGVGILLGAWWADHSWGRWWAFDPKELWALVTWLVYLVVVHMRFADIKNKPLATAWLSVLGFIVMLWCYFGVNLVLPGLHAYA